MLIINLGKIRKGEGIIKYPEFSHVKTLVNACFIGETVNPLHFPPWEEVTLTSKPSLPPPLQGRARPSSGLRLRPGTQPLSLRPPCAQHFSAWKCSPHSQIHLTTDTSSVAGSKESKNFATTKMRLRHQSPHTRDGKQPHGQR